MSAKKPAVGNIPLGPYRDSVSIIKQNIDMLTGRVGGELQSLPANATTAQIVTAINAIIARLNASTN